MNGGEHQLKIWRMFQPWSWLPEGTWQRCGFQAANEDGCGGWTGASRRVGRTHTRHTHVRYLYRSTDLSIYPSIHLSIYRSIYLSIYPSIHLSIYLSIYPSIYLSIHLFIYLSLSPYSISLSLFLYLFCQVCRAGCNQHTWSFANETL